MNVNTGELMMLMQGQEPPEGFTRVPDDFAEEAKKFLEESESKNKPAIVDMTQDTPLVNWAKHQRDSKKKTRTKMARASRRKNRKKVQE